VKKVSELTEPPVAGKFYLVMCVVFRGEWRPIVGPAHDDADIGVDAVHYHEDVRFSDYYDDPVHALARVIPISQWPVVASSLPELKRRKCLREMPDQRMAKSQTKPRNNWLTILEAKHVGRKVLCGKCPHKGMPLNSLPKDANGHVICNGHGLKIDMNKQEVIERA
jgi:hypothetical protein